jgi:hypothetical protein
MNEDNTHNLKERVLGKIQAGEVKMKPKMYFALQVILLGILAAATFAVSWLLVSYIFFTLRAGGYIYLLGFGTRGVYHFIMVFPWIILLIDMILLLIFDSLLKSFKFAYHSPVIYLFLGSLLVITLLASMVNFNSFHEVLLRRAEQQRLPIMGSLYAGIRRSNGRGGVFQGVVVELEGNTFEMRPYRQDEATNTPLIRVVFPGHASTTQFLKVGDEVFVAGKALNNEIEAYGIGKISSKQ